jgi:hypothetical protein
MHLNMHSDILTHVDIKRQILSYLNLYGVITLIIYEIAI